MNRTVARATLFVTALLGLASVEASAQSILRVVTWNVRHGNDDGPDEDHRVVGDQTTFLANLHPDVVILQEVLSNPTYDPTTYEQDLELKTGVPWDAHFVQATNNNFDGGMILSRIPFDGTPGNLHAQITFNSVALQVFATHFSFVPSERHAQIDERAAFMATFAGPRIVGGDFNVQPFEADYDYMKSKGYTDVWVDYYGTTNQQATHQDGTIRDYWFRSTAQASNVTPTNIVVPQTALSDHRPVVADLSVQPNGSQNLVLKGGFEEYTPEALGAPGWVADTSRGTLAKSETNQPHTGSKNGACWTVSASDCGMYQLITAPVTGTYTVTFYANADRTGGLVGADVNGQPGASANVQVRGFLVYGPPYTMTFSATAGAAIAVWMYSPAVPGYLVIDDVSVTRP